MTAAVQTESEHHSFPWRVPPDSFSYHAVELRRLVDELEQIGLPFALTSNNIDPFVVFVVVSCTQSERDEVIRRLESKGFGRMTSVITLSGYLAMLTRMGNDRPWVLGDPSALLTCLSSAELDMT